MAEAAYERHLGKLTKPGVLGRRITSNTQLEEEGSRLFGKCWSGVYPADRVKITPQRPCAIVNTDKSGLPGVHWCGLYMLPSGEVLGYDSYGRKLKDIVTGGLPRLKIKDTEDDAEQVDRGTDANTCGQRCLAWLQVARDLGPSAALKI